MSAVESLFETVLVRDGMPLRIDPHLARLMRSAAELGLEFREDPKELRRRCHGPPDGRMKLILENGFVTVSVLPFDGYPEELYREGAVAIVSLEPGHPLGYRAGHKSLPYDAMIDARDRALELGAVEVLFQEPDGALLEGSVSNLFVVRGNTLITPPLSRPILPGVTREAVLSLAPDLGLTALEADIFPADLEGAEEAFLTSSLMLAMPLRRVGDLNIPTGRLAREIGSQLI